MIKPKITKLNFSYEGKDSKIWVLNSDDIPLDKSLIKDQQIIHLFPGGFGGNHKHQRTEWFIGLGNLLFIWLDEHGKKHEVNMNPDGNLLLIEVPPFLPHAVLNNSNSESQVLFEYADAKQSGVERVIIVE
jgi:uncharacterized RmlC-like cupin family protein